MISNLVHLFCLKNLTNSDIFMNVIELEKYLIRDKYNPLKFKLILDFKSMKYGLACIMPEIIVKWVYNNYEILGIKKIR